MDEKLLEKARDFTADVEEATKEELVSVILYGSAVRGDFIPGRSDLNFLIVSKKVTEDLLSRLTKPFSKWRKKGIGVPLVLAEDHISKSLDSFPIEFLEMRSAYEVMKGKDVLKDLEVDLSDLRLQCEREIRGKLIQLRRGYLDSEGKAKNLEELFRQSVKSFLVIMRSALRLEEEKVRDFTGLEVISTMEKKLGTELKRFKEIHELRVKDGKIDKSRIHELFGGYLEEVTALAEWIDSWAARGGNSG
jgi:predicted nucleotidyltransferase